MLWFDILGAIVCAWFAGFLITLVLLANFIPLWMRYGLTLTGATKASALWFVTLPLAGYIAWKLWKGPALLRRPHP